MGACREAPDALRFEYTITSYVPKLSFAVLGRLGVVAVGSVTPDAQATTGQFVVDVAGMRAHLAPSANLLMWHVALPGGWCNQFGARSACRPRSRTNKCLALLCFRSRPSS